MSQLIVIATDSPSAAFDLRDQIATMARDFAVETEDVVVVTRDENGTIEKHAPVNTVVTQAAGGTVWGLGLGAIFLMPLVGAAVGAAAGALTGRLINVGIDNDFLETIGRELPLGTGAVALLARRIDPERLAALVRDFGGEVLHAALSEDVAEAMPDEIDVQAPTADQTHVADYREQPKL